MLFIIIFNIIFLPKHKNFSGKGTSVTGPLLPAVPEVSHRLLTAAFEVITNNTETLIYNLNGYFASFLS